MIVLGIDPGTATTGYGLVEQSYGKHNLLAYGTIVTPAEQEMALRLCRIHEELQEIIAEYSPVEMAVEQIFFHRNSKTIVTVAQSRGVLIMTGAAAGLLVAEYTPLQVKQAVVGYGGADKKQVQFMVQNILGLKEVPKPDDAADAIAVALCHCQSRRLKAHMNPPIKT
jgi:crossover junction endodeoxyribonuclease RuvC